MGRNLRDVLDALPTERQAKIDQRFQDLNDEIESLQQLRQIAEASQMEVATAMGMKQPSVSKIEKQTDMYLSTLRNYIESMGGTLELRVQLPNRRPLVLKHLGDVTTPKRKGKTAAA